MNDPNKDAFSWDDLTWRDIQSIGMALAEDHPDERILRLTPQRLTDLVTDLAGFAAGATTPDDFTLSAIATAWITAEEGNDDSSPHGDAA